MKDVVGSTLLGSDQFVEWAKETFLKNKRPDRDLPAVRGLLGGPSIESTRSAADLEFKEDRHLARRVALFPCHQLSGCKLREIGEAFGMGPSGVTQASRRVAQEVSSSAKLAVVIEKLKQRIKM